MGHEQINLVFIRNLILLNLYSLLVYGVQENYSERQHCTISFCHIEKTQLLLYRAILLRVFHRNLNMT
nr:MAG TPA: hypothetical protein [Caudoviricetes sp.]